MTVLPGFETLFGNTALKEQFSEEIRHGSLSHAFLLEGPKGSGRHTLALCVTYALALHENSPFSGKILEGCCPDVKCVGIPEKKKTIGVESIRALREETLLVPNDLSFRAFLIENAECMTPAAQNAALKILEEPPAGVFFFLLSENAAALLPTVRSRVSTLRMERFSERELRSYLAMRGVSEGAEVEEALRLADGCIGPLLTGLSEKDGGPRGKKQGGRTVSAPEAAKSLLRAAAGGERTRLIPAALALPAEREKLCEILLCFARETRDLLLFRSGAELPGMLLSQREEALSLCRPFTVDALLAMGSLALRTLEKLRAGASVSLSKTGLAMEMLAAARR